MDAKGQGYQKLAGQATHQQPCRADERSDEESTFHAKKQIPHHESGFGMTSGEILLFRIHVLVSSNNMDIRILQIFSAFSAVNGFTLSNPRARLLQSAGQGTGRRGA